MGIAIIKRLSKPGNGYFLELVTSPNSTKTLSLQSMAGAFHISRINEVIGRQIAGDIANRRQCRV
ncbi:hypothetical protein [Enterobacter asburiae]|uniref:hypothetical protein n=1 Tax=Enterobacter asburiae TaxID=61645 RepID=UPI0021CF3AF5|nr:hypothetical protein [Enterobacter asburiae]